MEIYRVKPLKRRQIEVEVPASKSILNRALILSAFSARDVRLICGEIADDTRDLLGALAALGAETARTPYGIAVHGVRVPNAANVYVGSAGTAARFLTAVLACSGGTFELHASPQMTRRPMELLSDLARAGVEFEFLGAPQHFPFRMRSKGLGGRVTVSTDSSTQYASGMLLAAALGQTAMTVCLTGGRTHGSYLQTTCAVIEAFGGHAVRRGDEIAVSPIVPPAEYAVEPDISGACYFYALSLFGCRVCVRGAHFTAHQADLKFLGVLAARGVAVEDTPAGIVANGRSVRSYAGFELDLSGFSDQALTLAALAPFAASPTHLWGLGHIRGQECDRLEAMRQNLLALGVPCTVGADEISISPAPVRPATIRTFGDHRVAMAFALTGLKAGGIAIEDPACCQKTFGNYFSLIDALSE